MKYLDNRQLFKAKLRKRSSYANYTTLQFSFCQQKIKATMSLQLHLNSEPTPTKCSKSEKTIKIKAEQAKLIELIEGFYSKAKLKIQKCLNKQNKKSSLLCDQILRALSSHPKQQLYQISRLHDSFFNEIAAIMNTVADLLKSMESLVLKMNSELNVIQERTLKKQEAATESQILILRKIRFKKQKTSLADKLITIDTINTKLIKFEENKSEDEASCSIEVEGKRLDTKVVKFTKIWFPQKRREYLLSLTEKSRNQGQLLLLSDKLQTITTFSKVGTVNLLDFIAVTQIQDFLYVVTTHSILRLNLLNEQQQLEELIKGTIVRAESTSTQLIIWVQSEPGVHCILFFTPELQLFHQEMLPLSLKSISHQFKLASESGRESVYFTSRSHYSAAEQLWTIQNQRPQLLAKDIGPIDEVIPISQHNRTEYAILRRGVDFYKFVAQSGSKKQLPIDIEKGQAIQKCGILGEHLYCLLQSGKYLLECHFPSP